MIRNRLTSVQRIQVAKDLMDSQDILSLVLLSDIEQIRLTMEETDRGRFQTAVDMIVNAKNLYIFGLRSASALANFMGFYYNLLFDNVRVINGSSASEVLSRFCASQMETSLLRCHSQDIHGVRSRPCITPVTWVQASSASQTQALSNRRSWRISLCMPEAI